MGWWDRWVWSRVANREALTLEQLLAEEGRPTASGEPVTIETALQLSTVWGCVRLLADSVSTLPLHVYRGDDRDPIPTPPLLTHPSADHPELADWLWAIMASLLLRGNAWGVITGRSGSTLLPAQVDLVHPDRVAVTTEEGRRVFRIGGKAYDREDLFPVKAYSWPGQLEGLSPIAYAREAIGLGIAAERYGAKFFGDSAIPSGVLTSDQRITRQDALALQERWRARHKGKRDIAVLGDGAKFQAVTVAPDEAQFIQSQQFNVSTICRIYGVPPEAMGGQTAGHEAYTSPEMRATDLLLWSIRPWLLRVERAVSGLLPSTQQAKFNAGGMVRATLRRGRRRMTLDRCFYPAGLHLRDDGDGRTLVGPVVPWNVEARVLDRGRVVVEPFERGALQGTDPARIPLTATHPRDAGTLPIGVTVELEERDDAAWGAWRVSDTALGNEVLALAHDQVPLGLSIGFAEVAGGSRWSPDRRRVTRTRAALDHVAVVRVPAYAGAGVNAVRAAPQPAATLLTLARLRG